MTNDVWAEADEYDDDEWTQMDDGMWLANLLMGDQARACIQRKWDRE